MTERGCPQPQRLDNTRCLIILKTSKKSKSLRLRTAALREFAIVIAICGLLFVALKNRAQQNLAGPTGGFNSVEYYPAPAQMQVKSRLSGADALPLEGGLLEIKQLRLETFATNGALQAVVTAPECVYDMPNQMANSPGKIFLQNGDGKIRVEGEGFLWRQNDSSLTISNRVRTAIESDSKGGFTP